MHGTEAASIMRKDLYYTGTIIGIGVGYIAFEKEYLISLMIRYILLFVIGVMGNALPEDMARFVACGANEVLTKPLTKMKLMTALTRYIS